MPKNYTDNTREKCVMARFKRKNELLQKNFTLKEYGTWPKARAAAKAWVQEVEPKLPPVESGKGRMTRRNSSGVVGVQLAHSVKNKNGNSYMHWRWLAFWPSCPNKGGISWGAAKYGEEAAFILAVLSRRAESIDRDAIYSEYTKIKGTAAARAILKLKKVESA